MPRVRFDTMGRNPKTGAKEQQAFSGVFKSDGEANKWLAKHGGFWRQRGRKLIRVRHNGPATDE